MKFKKGNIVRAQRGAPYTITSRGWIGKVTSVNGNSFSARPWSLDSNDFSGETDFPGLNSDYFDLLKQKTMKKGILDLKEGQYFTATYKKKSIRGEILVNWGDVILANKSVGDIESSDNTLCESGWNCGITVGKISGQTWEEALTGIGITNFEICTDRRQKAIINLDKCPELEGYTVKKSGNMFIFGCGAVEVDEASMKDVAKVKRALGKLEDVFNDEDVCLHNKTPKELASISLALAKVAALPAAVINSYREAAEVALQEDSDAFYKITPEQIDKVLEFYS